MHPRSARIHFRAACVAMGALVVLSTGVTARAHPALLPGAEAWSEQAKGGIRGVTVGPIENARHAGKGYGTAASARALDEAAAMGATWVSLTPFGRVWDLAPRGVDWTFETPYEANRAAVLRAIAQAHARGLKVLLVPHLWVETGGWRALIDFPDEDGWSRWVAAYRDFLLAWVDVAREGGAEMLSVGVELRSWVTTRRAPSFAAIVAEVRRVYPGLLTYSANWDDVDDTMILGDLDLIGVNAFYPLAQREGASRREMTEQARSVAQRLERLAQTWQRPVVLTEIGYTTRRDPALRPWEWPDSMSAPVIDQHAQADAYAALVTPLLDARWCAGFFAWRLYADPDDVSQEAEWGFSPRGKLAEVVLRDAFTAPWAGDGPLLPGALAGRHRARTPGLLGWEIDLIATPVERASSVGSGR